jgi:glutaredoxin
MNKIILYSNNCPKCKILKLKLDEKKIEYSICSDIESMSLEGIRSVPVLKVDDKILNFYDAIKYAKEYKYGNKC